MKNKILPVIAAVILIAAFGVALYPTVSQGINQLMSESAITQYNDTVDTLSAAEKTRQLAAAEEYNHGLSERVADSFSAEAFVSDESYLRILNVTENGQIGTIDIPSIDCRLPIYHGSGEDMLTKGAVHLAGTAFPIGSDSARSVISAHTAYPGKIFFDRLTEVKIGDISRFDKTAGNVQGDDGGKDDESDNGHDSGYSTYEEAAADGAVNDEGYLINDDGEIVSDYPVVFQMDLDRLYEDSVAYNAALNERQDMELTTAFSMVSTATSARRLSG